MRDNKTSQTAQEYDTNIGRTIPYYHFMHKETLETVKLVNNNPGAWLDAGCGTGSLINKAVGVFPKTRFVLLDPSAAMLDIAKEKFTGNKKITYVCLGTEHAEYPEESFDVITAILAHHYFDKNARRKATANCFSMLQKQGVYITFETILPTYPQGRQIGLERWRAAQLLNGKDAKAVASHMNRFGAELLPITVEEHSQLLYEAGFSVVEIFWRSVMQAGFYAIK